jgi:formate-dependent phosphoribosylglycinamide formyltransferase (GAR transformylase)
MAVAVADAESVATARERASDAAGAIELREAAETTE